MTTVFAIDFSGSTDRELAMRAAKQIAHVSGVGDVAMAFDHTIIAVVPAHQATSLLNNMNCGGTEVQNVLDWANGRGHKTVTLYSDGWFNEISLNTYDLLVNIVIMGADKDVAGNSVFPIVGRLC